MPELTPKEIVKSLDKYIISQDEAKRAVAIALRNRYRRSLLTKELQDEITPKNIIMIGPTGVGKTEIARRLSRLMQAPFIKVEATKFTEVGYVGRDVESMIRDLVEASIRMVKASRYESIKDKVAELAKRRIIEVLVPSYKKDKNQNNPFMALLNQPQLTSSEPSETEQEKQERLTKREQMMKDLDDGKLENMLVEIEVEDTGGIGIEIAGLGSDINIGEIMGGMLPKKTKKRKVTVSEARKILESQEADKLIDMDEVTSTAITHAEQDGIIFLDELDKVAGKSYGQGPDVSREGVQRDILPIVEGSTVVTKYGPVKTDYILFIAAGAFHVSKITDLIPELQGRFPIKVELKPLSAEDFKKILTQPENAIIKQYQALLETEGVNLIFKDDAIDAIAKFAAVVNETTENIGARRLHTIMENLLDDISFNAGGIDTAVDVVVDVEYVKTHLSQNMKNVDLQRYIL